MREIYSFDTLPEKDKPFAVYMKGNYMMIVKNWEEYEEAAKDIKKGEIIGWQPLFTTKTVPPFMQSQIDNQN